MLNALGNDAIAPDIIVALGRMPSPKSQDALAQLILNDNADAPLRVEAAKQIAHSLRQFGVMVAKNHASGLVELSAATDEPVFHQALAGVVGAMRPRSADAGARLRGLRTPAYDASAAPAARVPEPPKPIREPVKPPEPRPVAPPEPESK
jgi:hypothetical protein